MRIPDWARYNHASRAAKRNRWAGPRRVRLGGCGYYADSHLVRWLREHPSPTMGEMLTVENMVYETLPTGVRLTHVALLKDRAIAATDGQQDGGWEILSKMGAEPLAPGKPHGSGYVVEVKQVGGPYIPAACVGETLADALETLDPILRNGSHGGARRTLWRKGEPGEIVGEVLRTLGLVEVSQ